MSINIIIVDDDPIVVSSLKIILESNDEVRVLGTGKNGTDAVELFDQRQPDVVLIDIQMPEMDGLVAAEKILQQDSDAKILFLTTFADNDYIIKSLNIGAKGCILKQDFDNIFPALTAVMSGQSVFGADITSKLTTLVKERNNFDYADYDITEKEEEIILQVAKGLNNKEIATKLHLSEGTVRNYLSAILEKLDLRDRTQLAIFYYQNLQT